MNPSHTQIRVITINKCVHINFVNFMIQHTNTPLYCGNLRKSIQKVQYVFKKKKSNE